VSLYSLCDDDDSNAPNTSAVIAIRLLRIMLMYLRFRLLRHQLWMEQVRRSGLSSTLYTTYSNYKISEHVTIVPLLCDELKQTVFHSKCNNT